MYTDKIYENVKDGGITLWNETSIIGDRDMSGTLYTDSIAEKKENNNISVQNSTEVTGTHDVTGALSVGSIDVTDLSVI